MSCRSSPVRGSSAWLDRCVASCSVTEMCPPAIRFLAAQPQGTVKNRDCHRRRHAQTLTHTLAAIEAASGRALADQTVPARRRSFEALLVWARRHGDERVWAIEDCRHVSGALERFL